LQNHYQNPDKRPDPDSLDLSDQPHYAPENFTKSEVSQRPADNNQDTKNSVVGNA
jgi:hypothetical protein